MLSNLKTEITDILIVQKVVVIRTLIIRKGLVQTGTFQSKSL